MFPRSDRRARTALWALLALLGMVAPARGDEVAAYLDERGLTQLLAVHLEQELDRADAAAAAPLVERLASLYAQLLQSAINPVTRRDLQERGRRLLARAPDDSADELRLALLRGTYQQIETAAENHRLRLIAAEELERARSGLTELIPQLHQLRQRLRHRVERADRQLSRAGGADAVLLSSEAEEIRGLLGQCMFLHAWSLTYQAWLEDSRESATTAQRLFFELLDTENPQPQPEDVSLDLRGVESVARAILGAALCKSMTATSATALAWLALLDHPQAYAPMREEAPAWRLAILLEHGEYAQAQQIWSELRAREMPLPLAWIRLVAVHALEAPAEQPDAAALLDEAIAELAGRGELQQILALADRYGVDRLGGTGFALRYIRGLQAYHRARARHGGDQPARDAELRALYEQAAVELEASLHEVDAPRYAEAATGAQWLLGWCRYFQGELLPAREAFEQASRRLTGDQAAESLWMAIVSLDALVQARENESLQAELAGLIERFLGEFPSSRRAPQLILKRAQTAKQPSWELIDDLLAVPSDSAVWVESRRRAAELLLQLFHVTNGEERRELGVSYLEVSLPLLMDEASAIESPGSGGEAAGRFVFRCRAVMYVALDDAVMRLDAARQALELFDAALAASAEARASHEDEFEARRVELHLHSGYPAAAIESARALMERSPDSSWTLSAVHAVFRQAVELRRRGGLSGTEERELLRVIAEHGSWIRSALARQAKADPVQALAYAAAEAEARLDLWTRHQDAEQGRAALALYRELLAQRPRDPAFLRGAALLSEDFGDKPAALEHWRTLLGGVAAGGDPWFEAKFHVISLLAELEPARARAVMDQHKSLNPDYGPEPWRSRFQALDESIPAADEAGAAAKDDEP